MKHWPEAINIEKYQNVLVTGYAKAPSGTGMQNIYGFCGVVMEIDPRTDTIVDAECTLITTLGKRFFESLIVGRNIEHDVDHIIEQMRKRYIAPSRHAMIIAFKNATQRYWEAKKQWEERDSY